MKKLLLLLGLLFFAGNAIAVELIETWDDPLGGWRDRWVAQYTNMENYYICAGITTDENYRGNNPCGLWICDGNPSGSSNIIFDPAFGATIQFIEIPLQAFTTSTLTIYDIDGAVVASWPLSLNFDQPYGCHTTPYSANTPNGVSRFEIGESGIEGNMAIDNLRVITGDATPVEPTTWSAIKGLYR